MIGFVGLNYFEAIQNFVVDEGDRFTAIALPYISLCAPKFFCGGMIAKKTWVVLTEALDAEKTGEWKQYGKKLTHLVLLVGMVAGNILYPTVGVSIDYGLRIVRELSNLKEAIAKKDWVAARRAILSFTYAAMCLGSIFSTAPHLIAITLLVRALLEVYEAFGSFKEGKYLEILGNLGLAAICSYKAMPHLDKAFFNRPLNQEKFNLLMQEIQSNLSKDPNSVVDLELILKKKKYSRDVSGIFLNGLKLDKFLFNKMCFTDCSFERTSLEEARITNVNFNNCSFTQASFNDALLDSVTFRFCKMFETSFLRTRVAKSILADSDLTDCLLFRCKKDFTIEGVRHTFTRPVIGMLWNECR